jgi:acetyl esterase/lipase
MSEELRPIDKLKALVRQRSAERDDLPLEERRRAMDTTLEVFGVPEGVEVSETELAGMKTDRIVPAGKTPQGRFLYFHGGGYVLGSPRSHRHMTALLALKTGRELVVPDYRLAPEYVFPAAVEDGLAAYRALLDEGHAPGEIVLGGDSAGGGLTLAVLLKARDEGLPMPAAACLISPWVDLKCNSGAYESRADADPMIDQSGIADMAALYLGGAPAGEPLASPLFADLTGLPPLFIQVGDAEVLLDDSRLLAERAKAAGVDAMLDVWPEMIHVWHAYYPMLPEGARALDDIAAYLAKGSGAARLSA